MTYYPAGRLITDTSTFNGRFGKITALEDTVIATLRSDNIKPAIASSVTLNANCSIEGVMTQIILSSGSVIAYSL